MSFSFITSILFTIWIKMAQLQQGGPDEKEKTTALKDLLSRIDLDELMKKDEPPLEFPDTLEGFEYAFNEKGQLRHTKTGEPFVFNYREDLHRWNQKRYEALGEIITKYIYGLLEKECHLKKVTLPIDASESEPKSFIFMSEDAMMNPDKLIVLIHGSGVVRAGQWARRLIINEDLDSGTQIPYIKRAIEVSRQSALESGELHTQTQNRYSTGSGSASFHTRPQPMCFDLVLQGPPLEAEGLRIWQMGKLKKSSFKLCRKCSHKMFTLPSMCAVLCVFAM